MLEPTAELAPIAETEPATAFSAPRRRRAADIEAGARQGELPPPPPEFSALTHACFRAKLAALVDMAGKADATGFRAIQICPVWSRPKALPHYRDLAVLAIKAKDGKT